MKKTIELLAPAGDREAFTAAIQSGANAVYIGGKLFNARQYSTNFEMEEIAEMVNYAHIHEAKVYVTLNILLKNEELWEAVRYTADLFNVGVDALIVQDISFLHLAKHLFPGKEFHASTQMSIHNSGGASFVYAQGWPRVVLAREVNLEEIKKIKAKSEADLEIFIHGALCNAYSGQCLMSSSLGERSGNRGRCAQPCRLPYTAVRLNTENDLSQELFLLSPRDLCTIDSIEALAEAGVESLKIEGRMKKAEYVATVVKAYREKLDGHYDKANKAELYQAFNRDFTQGHLFGEYGEALMSTDKPNNKGVYIGEVKLYKRSGSLVLACQQKLSLGDGIELRKGDKSIGFSIDNILWVDEARGLYEIPVPRNDYADMKVYRTNDAALNQKSRSYFESEHFEELLKVSLNISLGQPIRLKAVDSKGHSFETETDFLVEEAQKNGMTEEKVLGQLQKLGGTIYQMEEVHITIEGNCFVPLKAINELRRQMTEYFDGLKTLKAEPIDLEKLSESFEGSFSKHEKSLDKTKLHIKVRDITVLGELKFNGLERIYLPIHKWQSIREMNIDFGATEIYLYFEKIQHEMAYEVLEADIKTLDFSGVSGFALSNLGQIMLIKDLKLPWHGDLGLNLFNDISLKVLEAEGCQSYTPSNELNLQQIAKMGYGSMEKEALVYGHIGMMHMKNCPFSAIKKCDKNCQKCEYHIGMGLRDRKDILLPIENCQDYSILYNAKCLFLADDVDRVLASKVEAIRLDFTFETAQQIQEVIQYHRDSIDKKRGRYPWMERQTTAKYYTKGQYFKGVL